MNMNIKELKRRAGITENYSDLSNLFFDQQGAVGANKTVLGKLAQQLKSVHDFIDQTETIRDHQMDTLLDSIRTLAYLDHMVKDDGTLKFTLKTSESIQEACCRACEQEPFTMSSMSSNDIANSVKNMESGVCSIMAGYDNLDRDEVEEMLTTILHYAWEILDNYLNDYETREIKRLAGLNRT